MNEFFKKTGAWLEKHVVVGILIIALLAFIVIVPCVYKEYCTSPKTFKADRVSEGIVPTDEDLKNAVKYDRVVIFGVDGAGGYFGQCDTPNFDRIFSEGNINLNGVSQYPTVSSQNWASMLYGVTAQKHQITNTQASLLPHLGVKYPSVFKTYAKHHKDATYFSAVDWIPVNYGIIENGIKGMTKKYAKSMVKDDGSEYAIDKKVAELAVERLEKHRDAITFLHFDCVDHAGHGVGYGSAPFVAALQEVDRDMGIVYDAYREKGLVEGTLFICVSDHGHALTGGHGGEEETEKVVTLAVAGGKGNIVKGTCGKYVTHDLASVILYALGEKQPAHYEGGVPKNLFSTLELE